MAPEGGCGFSHHLLWDIWMFCTSDWTTVVPVFMLTVWPIVELRGANDWIILGHMTLLQHVIAFRPGERRWRVLPKKFWWRGRFWSRRKGDASLPELGRKVLKDLLVATCVVKYVTLFWPSIDVKFKFIISLVMMLHNRWSLFSAGEIEGLKSQVEKTQVGCVVFFFFFCQIINRWHPDLANPLADFYYLLLSVNLADAAPGHFQMNHSKFV